MRAILAKLNKIKGVRGSMVVNRDGLVAASDFSVEVQEGSVGAVSSSILSTLETALQRLKMGAFTQFVIVGSENKVVIVNAGHAILLVLLQRDVNMGLVRLEIKEATAAVVANSRMGE